MRRVARWSTIALGAGGIALGLVWINANGLYRKRMAESDAAWAEIERDHTAEDAIYDPSMAADLPEIARRYFAHAIAPGTRLSRTVALEMEGTFRLGDPSTPREFDMSARQILAPPHAFVWIANMRSGPFWISGSDGLFRDHGWTRFWAFGAIPLVQSAATEGLDRSARARPALESIWAPASLLPRFGTEWEQVSETQARITFGSGWDGEPVTLTIDEDGTVTSVLTQRWSDENPEREFRLQPFGGIMQGETSFDGYTVPSQVQVGNHFGTRDYFPFYEASILSARFL